MEYVRLGLTDLKVSRVGVGCAPTGGYDYGKVDDQQSVAAIQRALDLGVNFFDTADVYGFGHSEEVLAHALGSRRHDLVVATKFGVKWDEQGKTIPDISPQWVVQALERSLRRLKLDCIPLYQIHWPDFKTPIGETLQALKKCRQNGKVRYIGCCNFTTDLMEEAQSYCRLESLQLPYSLAEREVSQTIRDCHEKHNVAVFSYSSLAQGLFSGKYGVDSRFEGTDLRRHSPLFRGSKLQSNLCLLARLREVSDRCGRTPAQVAIRWILENPSVTSVLTGIKRSEQIEENVGVLGWGLSPAEMDFLSDDTLVTETRDTSFGESK